MPYSLIPTIKSTETKEKLPTPNSDFMIDFDDDLFSEYGNTSKYHREKKPLRKKSFYQELIDPSDEIFLKRTTKELISTLSSDWLEESEFSLM